MRSTLPLPLAAIAYAVALPASANPCPAPADGQTELEAASETLAAGEYCYYPTTLTGGDLDPGGSTAIQWTDSGAWRPGARELHWVGRANGCGNEDRPYVHIIYDELTGASTLDVTEFNPCGHGYDHNTVDPVTDTVYFRPFNSDTISAWQGAGWNPLPAFNGQVNSAAALVFFPELGDTGSLIVASASVLRVFDGDAWSEIELPNQIGTLHNVAEYNPVLGTVIFGGGNNAARALYRLDADATLTQLGDAPHDLGANGQGGGMLTVDPLSGRMLSLDKTTGQWWELDVDEDLWQQTDAPPPVSLGSTFQAPISTWGLIALFEDDAAEDEPARLWLYRHSPGEPPGPPPGDTGGDTDGGDDTTGGGMPMTDGGGPGDDAGDDDGSTGDGGTTPPPGDGTAALTGDAGGSEGSGDSSGAGADSPAGCSCRSTPSSPWSPWLLWLLPGAVALRRRHSPSSSSTSSAS